MRWRTVIKAGDDSWDTTLLNTLIAEAKSQVAARGLTAADYIIDPAAIILNEG
jgi:hypothetical protein